MHEKKQYPKALAQDALAMCYLNMIKEQRSEDQFTLDNPMAPKVYSPAVKQILQ